MRPLQQALSDHDLVVLRVIGEWWEVDLTGADKSTSVTALAQRLSQLDIRQEMAFLPVEEAAALNFLIEQGGRVAVGTFSRDYGEVRQMGPGRLEREEPWLDPVSPAEGLWYRGFLYSGFDETPEGLLEFYYLPDELLAQFPGARKEAPAVQRPASGLAPIPDPGSGLSATTAAVDDLTTLLALAMHISLQGEKAAVVEQLLLQPEPNRRSLLLNLAAEMGLIRQSNGELRPTRSALEWLQQSREAQLQALADAWSQSDWQELRHTPDLIWEGEAAESDPLLARTTLLDTLPRDTAWYAIADLTAQIKEESPDFQRPGGNYDTWYVRDADHDGYLTGFAAWDLVEGRLLRFLIQGPLYWLGLVELSGGPGEPAYRLSDRALRWLDGEPAPTEEVRVPLVVQPDATILVPHNAGRHHRFQTARVAEALPVEQGKPFRYRLTPASLAQAAEQGIGTQRVLEFLADAGERSLPKSVQRGVMRWAENGVEGRLEAVVVLRSADAAILDTLRNNPKTRDYIGESLGEFAVTVRRDLWDRFRSATAQLGLLLDVDVD